MRTKSWNSTIDFLAFTKDAHEEGIEVRVQDNNVWLTQKAISQLFDVDRSVVTKHLKKIFESSEFHQKYVSRSTGDNTTLEIYADGESVWKATVGPALDPVELNLNVQGVQELIGCRCLIKTIKSKLSRRHEYVAAACFIVAFQ